MYGTADRTTDGLSIDAFAAMIGDTAKGQPHHASRESGAVAVEPTCSGGML
jgi:hypothetical protein